VVPTQARLSRLPYHMKVVVVEEGTRTELLFDRSVVSVGRSVDNDIRLNGHLVSRHHCRLETGPEGLWVNDLGSSNGTLVNGERIQRCLLSPGDQLAVGKALLQIETAARAGEEAGVTDGARLADTVRPGETQRIDPVSVVRALEDFGEVGMQTLTGEAQKERENLRVFAHIMRELVRETDLGRLLRTIVDSAVSLVGAERGFLLLSDPMAAESAPRAEPPDPQLMKVRVARSFDHEDIPIPASRLSMGIARRVATSGTAVLSVDAGHDDRFRGMASVEDLKLRSVMCLPISSSHEHEPRIVQGGRVEGLLYVDNRLQRGAFRPDDLDLMKLLADQASIAIRNARMVAEMRERNERLLASAHKIELLNEQLGRKVRDRDTELAVVRAELGRERGRFDYTAIVGASEGMRRVFQQLDRIIPSELPVLIQGESGTGKELIARAIHFNGPRKDKPFVSENCAALPDTLLESELFGHTRGAFTGAHRAKKGLLEQADGGTLLLDEIGDMSTEMQKKLLRVLQEGEFRALGSDARVKVDVRVIAASNRNLEEMMRRGEFREDLFYRVNVLMVNLPSLRERREDIPLLAETMLARAAREANRPVPHLPREVLAALIAHDWPGNVRELENEMRRIVVLAGEEVRLEHLSASVLERRPAGSSAGTAASVPEPAGNIRDAVADLERRSIEAALAEASGNKSRASSILGISRFALQRKLDKYGLSKGTLTGPGANPGAGSGVDAPAAEADPADPAWLPDRLEERSGTE
jgi:transcriptional regulator with GAF, ATPase, and Fis domain